MHSRKRGVDLLGYSSQASPAKKTKTIAATSTQVVTRAKVTAAASTGALVIANKTNAMTTSTTLIDIVQSSNKVATVC